MGLEQEIKEAALALGAAAVGVAGPERLRGPESMNPAYLLPGGKSIVSLMLPLDGDLIRAYLGKKDHRSFEKHETEVYQRLFAMGGKIRELLEAKGFAAAVGEPNLDYRFKSGFGYKKLPYPVKQRIVDFLASGGPPEVAAAKRALGKAIAPRVDDGVDWNLIPTFSHRYGAVAAGTGALGWSGNVLHPDYGARVLYETVVTDAILVSDPMMEETPCDGCRVCTAVCQSGFIHPKESVSVRIGGREFTHNKKGHNLRCVFVCGAFSGTGKHPEWSTWSPGRVELPENNAEMETFWRAFVRKNMGKKNWYAKVLSDLAFHTQYGFIRKPRDRFPTTCGNCSLVCWETRAQRKENLAILKSGGVATLDPEPYPVPEN